MKNKVTKTESFLELDGTIWLIEKKNGKIVSKEEIDGEACLKAVLYCLEEGLKIAEKQNKQ